jgi:hypothetical protein
MIPGGDLCDVKPLRAILLATLLLPVGCVFGYRSVTASDPRLGNQCYGAVHNRSITLPDDDGFRFVGEGRMGMQMYTKAPSKAAPGGTDKWSGLILEAEAGAQIALLREDRHTVWVEPAMQTGMLRQIQHEAGPSGHHNHVDDHHEVHALWEVGPTLRFGYSYGLFPEGRAVGLDLGIGAQKVASRGTDYFFEVRLLTLRW